MNDTTAPTTKITIVFEITEQQMKRLNTDTLYEDLEAAVMKRFGELLQ